MNDDDKMIEGFFRQMQEKDAQLTIPSPPETIAIRGKNRWRPLAVAASVLLLLFAYLLYRGDEQAEDYVVEIMLTHPPDISTESLADEEATFDTWESPTQSLIEDF